MDVKKLIVIVTLSVFSMLPVVRAEMAADAAAVVMKGAMLFSADGSRLGAVYRVTNDGSAQIIIDAKIVTVPVATISTKEGKLITTLKKAQVISLK
jgi:hypothetical protein